MAYFQSQSQGLHLGTECNFNQSSSHPGQGANPGTLQCQPDELPLEAVCSVFNFVCLGHVTLTAELN